MITSLSNARIKQLKELETKSRQRNREKLFVAEGFKMFEEVPVDLIKEIYVEESVFERIKGCSKETPLTLYGNILTKIEECRKKDIPVETVSEDVFKKASDTETPQGIIFVGHMPQYNLKDILSNGQGNLLILEDIQDPGNLGTMIRTAEGAGMDGIILSKGCVDIFNPKTIRATMGSLFRVPFVCVESLNDALKEAKAHKVTVYAAHLKGTSNYNDIAYEGRSAFLIGNEGNGLKDETADLADRYVLIPMSGKLESLNAAVAAAILMYNSRK